MSKEIYISSTPHETRLAIVENDALTEIYYERENEYTLAGSIYNGRVTRVLPGMQSSFVDIGLERDAFLYITDFLEEAPDSAEFDTSSNGDHAPRAPRIIEGESAGRTDGGARSDRGGRSRRGGRDRDRGSDRPDRPPTSDRGEYETPRPYGESADFSGAPTESTEATQIGEGAPAADGSRRWRGRRGRRRGRGNGAPAGETAQPGMLPVPAEEESEFDGETIFEGGASIDEGYPEASRSIEVTGSATESEPNSARADFRPREDFHPNDTPRGQGQRGENQRFGRRDRNHREGQRADEPRRDQRRDHPQRVPRGFAPSRDLYAIDREESSTGPVANAYPGSEEISAEPIILPGESLSKYRKGGEEPAQTGATATLIPPAVPANLYTLAAGWDGGATLPGETITRRGPSSFEGRGESSRDAVRGRTEGRREDRFGRDRGRRGDRGPQAGVRREDSRSFRNDQAGQAAPENEPAPVQNVGDVESSYAASEVSAFRQPEVAGGAEQGSSIAELQRVPQERTVISEAVAPQHAYEYEPSEASASYRIDPVAPSEYRQSAPVLEEIEDQETQGQAIEAEVPASTEPPSALGHEITAVSATGEMFSESAAAPSEATHHPSPMEVADPASPIQHEGAVMGSHREFDEAEAAASAPGSGFAPGSGLLTEEILDEDEVYPAIHASATEETDDIEEETLEGAADLGTMLREMSIDNITRTSPEILDEDELEEDELDEDELDEDELGQDESDQDELDRDSMGHEEPEDGSDEQDNLDDEDEDETSEELRDGFEEQPAFTGTADPRLSEQRQRNSHAEAGVEASGGESLPRRDQRREGDRRSARRDGRRDGRRGHIERGDRPRLTGGSGDRERSGRPNGRGRHSMQSTNLPAISDLLKPGQEILVQIAKEPIAKKGARITSHIALPGRFLVFMPTVNHTGVSRKIESDGERRRLKEILLSEKGEASGGFIVRTAASGATEEELRSDLRFLLNLWSDIKARSESSKSPALIYHDLNLIERILRDQVTDTFSAIWVDSETEYERVLRFLQRFQPSLIRRVKLYLKETPLFEQFGITEEINKALRSKVWLKSGGSIVINQTEALVAIDINTGKFVGKTARLEDTIVKTNLDAIPEIVRQIRLRDLGGIIIIDFIDMDERKNRNRVMAALEDELKNDRAPSKVLQFNDFGLVAITRKRVKQSLERTLSTTCNVCVGTGMVKSPVTVCNDIYVEMKKMHKHLDRGDVMLRVHPDVVKQLKTSGSKWLQEMEEMAGKTILVKSDPSLHPEQFDIH